MPQDLTRWRWWLQRLRAVTFDASAPGCGTRSWTPWSRIMRASRAGGAASVNTMSTSRRWATRTMASEANLEWSRATRRLREIFIAVAETPMSRKSEEHTSELQSLMRISYAVFCLKKKKKYITSTKQYHKSD